MILSGYLSFCQPPLPPFSLDVSLSLWVFPILWLRAPRVCSSSSFLWFCLCRWLGNSCQSVLVKGACSGYAWAQRGRWRLLNVCRRRFVRHNLRLWRRMGNIFIHIPLMQQSITAMKSAERLLSLSHFPHFLIRNDCVGFQSFRSNLNLWSLIPFLWMSYLKNVWGNFFKFGPMSSWTN